MKILFISHSYPPIKGGVEIQNYCLARELQKLCDTKIIANSKGKGRLPLFLPATFFRAFFLMMTRDVCLVGNGVLAPLAAALKFFFPQKRFFSVVHGLDITFGFKSGLLPMIYRNINIPALKRLDKLFMVGNFTISEAERAGIPRSHCVFIPNGVTVSDLRKKLPKGELSRLFGAPLGNKKVILRLARFVPHKGTDWFIRNVMPMLPDDVVMIAAGYRVSRNTAGDADNFDDCEEAVKAKNLQQRVRLMPSLPQEDLEILLNTVDLVVSPNINYPGSSEGFGINVIEAAACERVVLASDLQGLADAVKDGRNGFLVEPEDAGQWADKIIKILAGGDSFPADFGRSAGKYVEENYSWDRISARYLAEMEKAGSSNS
jgi:phosphatidylinositol alpha-1,6-mannosyltransferase